MIREIPYKSIKKLLDEVDSYNENTHYIRNETEKNLSYVSKILGIFDDENKCWGIASLIFDYPKNYTYLDTIAVFKTKANYGTKLIKYLIDNYDDLWLLSNPNGGEKLLEFYKKQKKLKEYSFERSIFSLRPAHFFYHSNCPEELKKYIDDSFKM